MPAPCFCLSPLRDWTTCCGEQTGLPLLSVRLKHLQKIRRAVLWAGGRARSQGLLPPETRSRHLGGSGRGTVLEGPPDPIPPQCLQLPAAVGTMAHHGGAGLLQCRCGAVLPWTQKAWKYIKRAYVSATALSSSQLPCLLRAICTPSPARTFWRSFICTGMGTKVQPALLAHHLAWPRCLCLCTPWIIRGTAGNAAAQVGGRFICTLESAERKAVEVVRSEEWFACKERLNEGLFSLEKKQHRGVRQRPLK